jgi:tetratricopeptide (TPR) repeat protein
MGFIYGLFDNPLVLWVVGLLALLFVYRFVAARVRIPVPGVGLSADDLVARLLGPRWSAHKLDQQVARFKKQRNFLAAGKALEDAGRLSEAAEAYLEGQESWAAAATYEKLGRSDRAAELFLQAGDYKKSAALFVASGKPGRAAQLFLEKGNKLEAARLFAQANQWGVAADLYEKSGYPARAAEAWAKDGKPLKAAEAYEKHFMENVSYSTTYSSTAAPNADQKSALIAGQLYEKAGQLERAVPVYEKGGYYKQAAEALLKLRQPARAAELFLRCEDNERAAAAFEQAGDAEHGAMLRGEAAFRADKPAEAAAWFVKGRDFLRAAELFESVGMSAEAARAFEQGESWSAAGNVYMRAGLKENAAAAYEKAGELETAATIYEQIGDRRRAGDLYGRAGFAFKSGETAALAGDSQQAITLLQRVHQGDEHYRAATELLARLFIETGRPAVAEERLRKVIGNEAVSPGNLDLYYWLAVAHEASGARPEALALYKQIQAEDLQFRDVAERMERLEAGRPAVRPAPLAAAAPQAGPVAAAVAPAPRAGSAVTAARAAAPAARPAAPAAPAVPAPKVTQAPGAGPRPPRFVPKEEIGRGPLGVVHRGEDTTDGRNVAMRLIPRQLLSAPGLLPALAADLKAAAQLSHPNIVKVIAFMDWKGERCVVTEHVPGRNFAEAIASGRRLGFQQVHALGRIAAQVLVLLHEKGLVHGSIQPSNVMVASGVIKLADLGLGRLAQAHPSPASYHAPEGGLSAADDVYALAGVIYHLLTGSHPRSQAQGVGLPLPSQLAPGVPEAMDKLLLKTLHPRPELRAPSAAAFLDELRQMVRIG